MFIKVEPYWNVNANSPFECLNSSIKVEPYWNVNDIFLPYANKKYQLK